jgi:hypothetical protein
LKRSSIFFVTRKPPAMLIAEMSSAPAASSCVAPLRAKVCAGSSSIAPTAVSPEIALVTDMSGEWSAGGTPATACQPARPESANVVRRTASCGSPDMPMAVRSADNTVSFAADDAYFFHSGTGGGGGAASGGGFTSGGLYGGAGYVSSPEWTASMPRTASSS